MFKVVIVDDEIWICKMIKKIINWEELNMTVIDIVNDGMAAYETIIKNSPDIIITDIRMPGLDGLGLIKKIKENNIKANFIIISGYQDFEYAQKAIKYGVNNYLTKPIEEDDLYNSLKKIAQDLEKSRIKKEEEQLLTDKLTNSIDKLKRQFLSDILSNNLLKNDVNSIQSEYHLNFKNGFYQVIIYKIDSKFREKTNLNYKDILFGNFMDIVNDTYEKYNIYVETLILKNKIVCILNSSNISKDILYKAINETFECMREQIFSYHRLGITVAVGSVEEKIEEIYKSNIVANEALKARVTIGINRIIDISNDKYKNINAREILSMDKKKQFECFIDTFNIKGISKWINDIYNSINETNINPTLIYNLSLEILDLIKESFENKDLKYNERDSISDVALRLEECLSKEEIIDVVTKFVLDKIEELKENNENKSSKPIEIAKEYISKKYMDDISLTEIAKKVYLNPTYLSELFKKETGVNFSEYIINYRIDIAKDLLKHQMYKISDVSKMVGYIDSRYFSKLFKKVVGISPGAYKKINT